MAPQAETTSDPLVVEFREALSALGITQHRVARLFGVGPRSVRRWQHGDRHVPCGVGIVFRLLAAGAVTIDQIERVAVPIPAQTNGNAKPESPAPLLVEPAPAQAAEAATFVDSDLSTAQKVLALGLGSCRWPIGDPRLPGFHFCSDSALPQQPYCARPSPRGAIVVRSAPWTSAERIVGRFARSGRRA